MGRHEAVSKVQLQSAKVIDCKLRQLYRPFTSVFRDQNGFLDGINPYIIDELIICNFKII
jgi:hypothetical protein